MENEDITKYLKGTAHIEDREKYLFDLIDKLDEESLRIFSDVIDANEVDFYKTRNLHTRISSLDEIIREVIDNYEYLAKLEEKSYDYAVNRYRLKLLLSILTTGASFAANPLLGVISFVLLMNKANKDYTTELRDIGNRIGMYDDAKVNKIVSTIANAARIYEKKASVMQELFIEGYTMCEDAEDDFVSIDFMANLAIMSYQSGDYTDEDLWIIPDAVKEVMVEILGFDLKNESKDLKELLHKLNEKDEKSIELIKKYKKVKKS